LAVDVLCALLVIPIWTYYGTIIALVSALVGVVCVVVWRLAGPAYFRGETLNRSTPTLVPEDSALPLGPHEPATGDEDTPGAGVPGGRPGAAPAA